MSLLSYTRALLIAEVRRQVQERSSGLFLDADFERWVDLAILDICTRTRCLREEATANSVSAQQAYTIPDTSLGCWSISKVRYDNVKLEEHVWDEIETVIPTGHALSSTGTPSYWSPYGRSVRLTPIPNAADKEIEVWHARMPDTMSADSVSLNDLGVPEFYGPAVETFMRHRAHLLSGDQQQANVDWQMYIQQVGMNMDKAVPDVPEGVNRGAG